MRNSSDRLETLKVKAALISYFRFYKNHDIICTEFSYGKADVLSISNNGKGIYEVEVKVSLSDLKREPKKYKHKRDSLEVTNSKPCRYFYLAIPKFLEEQAKEILKQNFPNAGLYVLRDGDFSSYGASGISTVIKAQPTFLPHNYRYGNLEKEAIRGMANNLAKVYSDLVEAKRKLIPLRLF
jgi:hypothetical protein